MLPTQSLTLATGIRYDKIKYLNLPDLDLVKLHLSKVSDLVEIAE